MPNKYLNKKRNSPARAGSVRYSRPRGRPLRVLPLAIGAAALVCGSMAVAANVLHEVSGDRYAVEIIKDEFHKVG